MPPAIPTPFDITDIPVIPWTPGLGSWLTALLLLGLAYAMILGYRRILAKQGFAAAAALEDELATIGADENHTERQRLIKLAQRALVFLQNCDVRGLSSEELITLSAVEGDAQVRKLLTLLAALENDQYAPPKSHGDPEVREHARQLNATLREFLFARRRS